MAITVLSLMLASTTAQAESFRCGARIVSEDSTVEELLELCGEPTMKSVETVDVYGPTKSGGGRVKRGTITIEKWTYDRGSQSFPMVVTIEDGKIKRMERGR
ncbi:MAG: DUF2845 domain-containing protein [Gammaproteobacteria bacterium]